MRVHLLAIPNVQTTKAYALDGFCTRTILFSALLKRLGHTVLLYASEENDAPCDSLVTCIKKDEIAQMLGQTPYQATNYEAGNPLFMTFNVRASAEIRFRKQPGDVIATIGGSAQHLVYDAHPELPVLEYSIGYRGVHCPYRIYQSHIWRHVVHGYTGQDSGRVFDSVIYPWFEPEDFPVTARPDPYVVFCGRFVPTKGIGIICDAAKATNIHVKWVGFGDRNLITWGDVVGEVSTEDRNKLLSQAMACMMPTSYIEPFGNVSAEAQLCGTPVISTDFGAFVESVEQGKSGYRCRTLGEFIEAIRRVKDLDRSYVRARALRMFSTDAAAVQYASFFRRWQAAIYGGQAWRDLHPGLEDCALSMPMLAPEPELVEA